jgi:hypothetical protein
LGRARNRNSLAYISHANADAATIATGSPAKIDKPGNLSVKGILFR